MLRGQPLRWAVWRGGGATPLRGAPRRCGMRAGALAL
jgi:hypothetical protein